MRHEFEREIEEGRTTDVLDATAAYAYEPPFRCQQLNNLVEEVEKFLVAAKPCLRKTLTAAVPSLEAAKMVAARWTPLFYRPYNITPDREENWRIIQRWPEWEKQGFSWDDRFDEHLTYFRSAAPRHPMERSRLLNNFQHRCRFLRCPCRVRARKRSRLAG